MPEVASSALSPTETATVRSAPSVLPSWTVAVTVTDFAPPSSVALDGLRLRSIVAVSSSVSDSEAELTV